MLLTKSDGYTGSNSPVRPIVDCPPLHLYLEPPGPTLGISFLWPSHPLLLAGHKGLEPWGYAKAQLVDEGRFILTVDLHFDACFEGRLIYGNERCVCWEGFFFLPNLLQSWGPPPSLETTMMRLGEDSQSKEPWPFPSLLLDSPAPCCPGDPCILHTSSLTWLPLCISLFQIISHCLRGSPLLPLLFSLLPHISLSQGP